MNVGDELIRLDKLTKRFDGVLALNEVSLEIRKGEVHAIVGENGAGKSTLMKILAGIHAPDSGTVYLRGQPIRISDPREARQQGVSLVFQELNLFPHLTATANIFINREWSGSTGLLRSREMEAAARAVFELMGVTIDPQSKISALTVGEKQQVEIARTLQQQSEIIIMDEPNSALTQHESARLFELIRRLRDQGLTIVYISHRLEEVFAVADRISVLRDGRYQGTWPVREVSIPFIVSQMIGRKLDEGFPQRPVLERQPPALLEVRDLTGSHRFGPVSLQLFPGEILGLAGLEGAGVETLFHILFGLEKANGGQIFYRSQPQSIRSPVQAIQKGWSLIPASRRDQGLMMDWSVRQNMTLVVLDQLLSKIGLLSSAHERQLTQDYVQKLNIVTDDLDKRVVNLSGGNQQKVVVAKWLASQPQVLILHDPTRGVDVGAKAEIYQLCDRLARQGLALLFTSSELEETLGLCDRILVFSKGHIVRECLRGEADKGDIVRWMSGETAAVSPQ